MKIPQAKDLEPEPDYDEGKGNEFCKPELGAEFRKAIRLHGPVSFKWLMEQCLYHPEYGYYSVEQRPIGQKGDFYTNVSVGKLFGQLMARQFAEMWNVMGRPRSFSIVEQGAHDGQFADDVLDWIQECEPELFEIVTYWIMEPQEGLREKQRELLSKWPRDKVRWREEFSDIDDGSFFGVFFCNELLDAFPVHLVTLRDGIWYENYVDHVEGQFFLTEEEPSTNELRYFLEQRMPNDVGHEPYRTEVNIRALSWIDDVTRILRRGFILICDYGFPRYQYLIPERYEGTLTGYYQHRRIDNIFEYMGNCDITSHVDFTTVAEQALFAGLGLTGFTDQHHFMVGLGQQEFAALEEEGARTGELPEEAKQAIRAFKTLMHPELMGRTFKYLCLSKELEEEQVAELSGFQHASDPYDTLGIEVEE